MFQTRLTAASKDRPNFAGHYKFVIWGCGSECAAGAIVDQLMGKVYPPPLAKKGEGWQRWISCFASFKGSGYEYKVESRLMIVRCGLNLDEDDRNYPDIYYLLWEGTRFKELLHIPGKHA